jgi:hypothetical protein
MSSRQPETPAISPALVAAWHRSLRTQAQAERAYDAFLKRRSPPRRARARARDVAAWLCAGMLLGMGSLYAATSAYQRWQGPAQALEVPTPSERGQTVTGQRAPRPLPSAPGSAETAPAPVDSRSSRLVSGAPPEPAKESWQSAARGLRDGDFEAADEALLKLTAQGTPAERDAAKLVRGQVLLRQGRRSEARALLAQLSAGGVSTVTKQRATQLLQELSLAASSHRSFEPPPRTDLP